MSDRGTGVSPFPPAYRASGVLLHVTSLPSPYGVGDLGPGAFAWVDRLCEAGQSWRLPLGLTEYGDSPYQCLSSFAGNGLLISPDGRIDDGLLGAADCVGHAFSPTAVEYQKVIPFKLCVLETAWRRRPHAIAPLQDTLNLGNGLDERSGPGRGQLELALHGGNAVELRG